MATFKNILLKIWSYAEKAKHHTTTAMFLAFSLFCIFIVFITFMAMLFSSKPDDVQRNAALYLELNKPITEQKIEPDSILEMIESIGDKKQPSSMQEILKVIELAKDDDNITGIVLSTQASFHAGVSKILILTKALQEFKASGKKIYAVNSYYSQEEYLLASVADKIFLNTIGGVEISGFSRYRTYMKGALEKLKITMNIFRVGTYKAALEPFFRNDMSDAAKEANLAWITALWKHYKAGVQMNRPVITSDAIENYANNFETLLAEKKGSLSQLAISEKLVDEIADQSTIDKFLITEFGQGNKKKVFNYVLPKELIKKHSIPDFFNSQTSKIAVVVVQGVIVDGESSNENAGGDSIFKLIQQAEKDQDVKALLLRVDSGGGSVFASEQIRSAIISFKNTGRPMFASFGSMAASGGYWISTPAEEIWCESTTLTGSIGIFGAIPSFEKLAPEIGLNADGIATSEMAEGYHPFRALSPKMKNIFQQSIENGYSNFLDLVSKSRKMSVEDVDKIAQGRVWSGDAALANGLIDKIGGEQEALASLAKRAGLIDYDVEYINKELNDDEKFLHDVLENIHVTTDLNLKSKNMNQLEDLIKKLGVKEIQPLLFNDPHHAYVFSFITKAP